MQVLGPAGVEFLHQRQTQALGNPAMDLPFHLDRVDGPADIVGGDDTPDPRAFERIGWADEVDLEIERQADVERAHQTSRRDVVAGCRLRGQGDTAAHDGGLCRHAGTVEMRSAAGIHIGDTGCPEPHFPIQCRSAKRPAVIVQQRVVFEVAGLMERVIAGQEHGAADRKKIALQEDLGMKSRVRTTTVTHRHVDTVLGEIDHLVVGGDVHVDLGMGVLKVAQARQQPLGRDRG